MCEGSFLPSSFGRHQKHTEFESSLRSYLISDVATCADRQSRTSLCLLGRGRRPPSRRHLESNDIRDPGEGASYARAVYVYPSALLREYPISGSRGTRGQRQW